MKKIATLLTLAFLAYQGYCQKTINFNIYIDDVLQSDSSKNIIVKLKFKDEKDTLILLGKSGEIKIPSLERELSYVEIKYDIYSCYMEHYMAEIEGKSIFNRSVNDIQIRIDKYPFSNLTKQRFSSIQKNQYSMIFGRTNDNPENVESFGFFNTIGKLK